MPFYFVSAANGTNVVRVFTDAARAAVAYKENSTDILDQIIEELEVSNLITPLYKRMATGHFVFQVMERSHEIKDGELYVGDLP